MYLTTRNIYKYLSLSLLVSCSLQAYAATNTAKIGMSVSIKASPQCDYNYSLEKQSKENSYDRFTSCDIHSATLQQHLEHLTYNSSAQSDEKRYRMFITVE